MATYKPVTKASLSISNVDDTSDATKDAATANLTNKTITLPVINQFSSASGLGAAWSSWTPTLGGITIGNGVVVARYTQIGKTVHAYIEVTWGTTTSQSGAFTFSLPVTANSNYSVSKHSIGEMTMYDNSATQLYMGKCLLTSTTAVTARIFHADGVYLYSPASDTVTATQPQAWAVSDVFAADLVYESV